MSTSGGSTAQNFAFLDQSGNNLFQITSVVDGALFQVQGFGGNNVIQVADINGQTYVQGISYDAVLGILYVTTIINTTFNIIVGANYNHNLFQLDSTGSIRYAASSPNSLSAPCNLKPATFATLLQLTAVITSKWIQTYTTTSIRWNVGYLVTALRLEPLPRSTTTVTWGSSFTSTTTLVQSTAIIVAVEVPTPTVTVTAFWTGLVSSESTVIGNSGQSNTLVKLAPQT